MDQTIAQGIGWMSEAATSEERQIVKRIARGDRQALAELYTRFRQPLFHYLLQLTPDIGLAEELLQDTLVAVWQSARTYEARSTVLTWLIGIARRQAHNTLRQRGLPRADATELHALPAAAADPADIVLADVARLELGAAFQRLAPLHREILGLIFVQEVSYQEAAAILGVPIGTVKSRLNHARRALRAQIDAREEAER